MPSPPTPLKPSQGQNTPRKELSPSLRGKICGMHQLGAKYSEIARHLNLSQSTVRTTVLKASIRKDNATLSRSGRPQVTTPRDERKILREIRRNPKSTYAQLKIATGCAFGTTTYKKMLKKHGITK